MSTTHTYQTSLQWNETRKGTITAPGLPAVTVATPPQFPGGIDGIWSPEHLFVASAEACLMTTFLAIAENSRLEFSAYSSTATGTLEKTEAGMVITEITIHAKVTVTDESKVDRATRILEKSKAACLISNSMKSEVHLEPEVTVA